ncbi:type I restriction modification DNA specificity domain-containing protein, partial [mine drainage metagenome]
TIGECAINRVSLATNQGFKNFIPHDDVEVEFLYYLLLTQRQGFVSLCGGSTFLEIGKRQLASYSVSFPPSKAEQEAIAEALSDADALIDSLERLIAKKRAIKQGAMQQLLTGQTRLPCFHGEWEVKRLADLFKFSGGYSASRDQLSTEGYCYLHYGDIHGSSKTTIDTSADHQEIPKLAISLKKVSPDSLLADGDVVFVDAS